jgi:hypothetical protein
MSRDIIDAIHALASNGLIHNNARATTHAWLAAATQNLVRRPREDHLSWMRGYADGEQRNAWIAAVTTGLIDDATHTHMTVMRHWAHDHTHHINHDVQSGDLCGLSTSFREYLNDGSGALSDILVRASRYADITPWGQACDMVLQDIGDAEYMASTMACANLLTHMARASRHTYTACYAPCVAERLVSCARSLIVSDSNAVRDTALWMLTSAVGIGHDASADLLITHLTSSADGRGTDGADRWAELVVAAIPYPAITDRIQAVIPQTLLVRDALLELGNVASWHHVLLNWKRHGEVSPKARSDIAKMIGVLYGVQREHIPMYHRFARNVTIIQRMYPSLNEDTRNAFMGTVVAYAVKQGRSWMAEAISIIDSGGNAEAICKPHR